MTVFSPVVFQALLDSIFGVQLSSVTWKYLHFEFCGNPLKYFLSWHTVHIETFREGTYFYVSLYYYLNYYYVRENMSVFSSWNQGETAEDKHQEEKNVFVIKKYKTIIIEY